MRVEYFTYSMRSTVVPLATPSSWVGLKLDEICLLIVQIYLTQVAIVFGTL